MQQTQHSIRALIRLNQLEGPDQEAWALQLTKAEFQRAREQARKGVPTYVLGHHDRLIARNKRSVAVVRHGVCSACHMKLPSGHRRRSRAKDLDVCDHCGVFLVWEEETDIRQPQQTPRLRATGRKTKEQQVKHAPSAAS